MGQNAKLAFLLGIAFILTTACAGSKEVRTDPAPSAASLTAEKFFERIKQGDTEAVRSMIAAGMDPNVLNPDDRMGTTTLQAAIGNIETMKVLISAGANVNAGNIVGSTPLIWSAYFGQFSSVLVLLDAGADINLKNLGGITPLMDAGRMNRLETSILLLTRGADVDATNSTGMTALMLTAWNGNLDVVEVLMAAGANVNTKSKDGKTALSLAAEHGHTDIVEFLRKAGAVKSP